MKLSKKGAQKCFDKMYLDKQPIQAIDFEADDFKGMVVLSIEEAKALLRCIPEFKESGGWQLPIERLKERIAKAEMSIASTQCENVSKKDEKIDMLSVKQVEMKDG